MIGMNTPALPHPPASFLSKKASSVISLRREPNWSAFAIRRRHRSPPQFQPAFAHFRMISHTSRLLFLAEFLESGIGAQLFSIGSALKVPA